MSEKLDFGGLFDFFTEFIDTFFNDVMNEEMRGLLSYLFSCFPPFIRSYMIFLVVAIGLLSLWYTIKKL